MRLSRDLLLLIAALAFSGGSVGAQERSQSTWTVTVTPTMNPVPAGFCAAVRLDIVDASGREPPRNPQGYRVTMADFDMSVSASVEGAMVGQQIDRNHWSVCGCPGALAGTQ